MQFFPENKENITIAALKKHPTLKQELEGDADLLALVEKSPVIRQRLDKAPNLIAAVKEGMEDPLILALVQAPFLNSIPAADWHSQIHELSEIKFSVEHLFDSIMDCPVDEKGKNMPALSPEQKLRALQAIQHPKPGEDQEFKKLRVEDPIQELRKILQHPKPQNRKDYGAANAYGRGQPRQIHGKTQIYYALSGNDFHRLLKPEDIKKLGNFAQNSSALVPSEEYDGEMLRKEKVRATWPNGITFKNGYRITLDDIVRIHPKRVKQGNTAEAFYGWEDEGIFALTAKQTPTYCMTQEPIIGYLNLLVDHYKNQANEELGIHEDLSKFPILLKQSYTQYDSNDFQNNYLFLFQLVSDPQFDSPENIRKFLFYQAGLPPAEMGNVSKLLEHLQHATFGMLGWDPRKQQIIAQGQQILRYLCDLEKQQFQAESKPEEKDSYIFALSRRSKQDQLKFWAKPERAEELKALIAYLKLKRTNKSLRGIWEYQVLLNALEARTKQMSQQQYANITDPDERLEMVKHLSSLSPTEQWLACNNQSAHSLELLQSKLAEEKNPSAAIKNLQEDIALVQSTPALHRTAFATLNPSAFQQKKQFIWGLLQLGQLSRLRILTAQMRNSENNITGTRNRGIELINSWAKCGPEEFHLNNMTMNQELAVQAMKDTFLPQMQQARNLTQFSLEAQAFVDAVDYFGKPASMPVSIAIMLGDAIPEKRYAFIAVLFTKSAAEIRAVIRQTFIYYPSSFAHLKRELSALGPVMAMYQQSFAANYQVALEEVTSLAGFKTLHAQPYGNLTTSQQERFLIGLLRVEDHKERLAILNRQKSFGTPHITALLHTIEKNTTGANYKIPTLDQLVGLSSCGTTPTPILTAQFNRYREILAEIHLVNKMFWPRDDKAYAAATPSLYETKDFNFPVFPPDTMKALGKDHYYHSKGYQELTKLQMIIDLLGAGSIKRGEILKYLGAKHTTSQGGGKQYFCTQMQGFLINLVQDPAAVRYLSQFGPITALQAALRKHTGINPSLVLEQNQNQHQNRDLLQSVVPPREIKLQVEKKATIADKDAFREQVAKDLLELRGETKSALSQQKIRAGRIIRYFQDCKSATELARLSSLLLAQQDLFSSPLTLEFLRTFIQENNLHPLDAVDQQGVIQKLSNVQHNFVSQLPSQPSMENKLSDSKDCSLPIKVTDAAHLLWEDGALQDKLGWNDVFEKIRVGTSEAEAAAVCSIKGERTRQEDRAVAQPLLWSSLLTQDEIAVALRDTYAEIQQGYGQQPWVGSTGCTTVSQRVPAGNGKGDIITAVNAQLGDSYSFLVVKTVKEEKNIRTIVLEVHPLSRSIHTLSNKSEKNRIKSDLAKKHIVMVDAKKLGENRFKQGAPDEVKDPQQEAGIVPTRCFGQTGYEQDGLSHEPEIFHSYVPVPADAEAFIINASDGIFPHSTPAHKETGVPPVEAAGQLRGMLKEFMQQEAAKTTSPASLAQFLVKNVVKHSPDNMTVSVTPASWSSSMHDGNCGPQVAAQVAVNIMPCLDKHLKKQYEKRVSLSVPPGPLVEVKENNIPKQGQQVLENLPPDNTSREETKLLKGEVQHLKQTNDALQKKIQETNEKIKNLESNAKQAETLCQEIVNNQAITQQDKEKFEKAFKERQQQILNLQAQLQEAQTKLSSLAQKDATIFSLQGEEKRLQGIMASLNNQYSSLAAEYKTLKALEEQRSIAAQPQEEQTRQAEQKRQEQEETSEPIATRKVLVGYYASWGTFGLITGAVINSYLLESKLDFPFGNELPLLVGLMLGCVLGGLLDSKFNITGKITQHFSSENSPHVAAS